MTLNTFGKHAQLSVYVEIPEFAPPEDVSSILGEIENDLQAAVSVWSGKDKEDVKVSIGEWE